MIGLVKRRAYLAPVVVLVAGLAFLAGGIFELVVQETGRPARATIVDCEDVAGKYGGSTCRGTWVAGGSLLEGGHVVIGTVDGATRSDLGHSIDVRLSGGRAYTTSLRVPIILLALGACSLVGGVFAARGLLRKARRARAESGPAGSGTPTAT